MANVNDIPRGYAMTGKLNLRADPREYRRWNLFSAVLGLGLIAAGWVWHSFAPLKALFEAGFSVYFLRIAALAAGLFLYAQGYQLTRALALRLLGGQGPCWRRQGLLQIPGSYAYFSRGRFALAALSPLLLWTAALLGACFLVPVDWFWIVYLILIYDLGGNLAVFHAVYHVLRAPKTALVRTTGVQTLITLPYGIGSFIMGGLYAVTVVAGIHHMYTLIDLGQLARYGYTYWLPLASAANVAQGGAALAVALKSKDTKVKSMALPSALSACMGITEPAIFGVNLRYFKPFLGGLLGGACGAWYASIVGLGATGTGVTGIFGILLHLHMPLQYIIMMAISFGVSFAVTWVIWSPEEVKV